VALVVVTPNALSDLERLRSFLVESDPAAADQTIELILAGTSVVADHPLIGRPVESAYRELVISRGRSGYIALYRYNETRDAVLVLAIRHQREAGYV
jgi:plasmid stabilization system protein ParE